MNNYMANYMIINVIIIRVIRAIRVQKSLG